MEKIIAKLGAAIYVCWGLLHFAAAYGTYKVAQNSPATIVQGRLMQWRFIWRRLLRPRSCSPSR
jgi:hypothetical protein